MESEYMKIHIFRYCPYYRVVHNSEVSARRELNVISQYPVYYLALLVKSAAILQEVSKTPGCSVNPFLPEVQVPGAYYKKEQNAY